MAPTPTSRDLSSAELFREYAQFVARFLYRLGVPADAIEDTVQEVFLVAHARGGYREGPAKPTTYLGVIATNAAATHRRRTRTRGARETTAEPDELRSERPTPEHDLETRDQLRRLKAALDKLDPELRATLLLADGEGETCVAIGRETGTPVGTVYWRLHEARRRFRRALAQVDAASHGTLRPRPLVAETGPVPVGALARSMGVLIMAFGWLWPGWGSSKARALLREANPKMPVEYDVETGLARYERALTEQQAGGAPAPLPHVAAGTKLASVGAKAALAGVAGGLSLLVGLHLTPPANDAASEPRPVSTTVEPTGAPEAAVSLSDVPAGETPARDRPTDRREGLTASLEAPEDAPTFAVEGGLAIHGAHFNASARGGTGNLPTRAGRSRTASGPRAARRAATPSDRPAQAPEAEAAAEPKAEADAQLPAPPASRPSPPPRPTRVSEVQALGDARRLLRTDPAQSLALAQRVAESPNAVYLAEERRYIEVMALFALDDDRASRSADDFLARYPQSGFRERVERVRAGGARW